MFWVDVPRGTTNGFIALDFIASVFVEDCPVKPPNAKPAEGESSHFNQFYFLDIV